ncbi:MAG: hypothetical protein DMF56_10620 [Acidobacteria bacterium]|nr:MAG: hypothetical protein DMF56_10620 [Acidobacteriota bacterium]
MTTPATGEPKKSSPRRKDAIIAAIATVLAAVILASGTIIAAGKRDRDSLRDEAEALRQEMKLKIGRITQLETDVAVRDRQLQQLRQTRAGVIVPSTTDVPVSSTSEVDPWPEAARGHADADGFGIDFFGCVRVSGNVECRFKVTNTKQERDFRLQAAGYNGDSINSRGIDPHGQQVGAQRGTLGGGDEDTNPRITIPNGITIRGTVLLPDVSAAMTEYVVFQLGFDGDNRHRVDFRNVKLGA